MSGSCHDRLASCRMAGHSVVGSSQVPSVGAWTLPVKAIFESSDDLGWSGRRSLISSCDSGQELDARNIGVGWFPSDRSAIIQPTPRS